MTKGKPLPRASFEARAVLPAPGLPSRSIDTIGVRLELRTYKHVTLQLRNGFSMNYSRRGSRNKNKQDEKTIIWLLNSYVVYLFDEKISGLVDVSEGVTKVDDAVGHRR